MKDVKPDMTILFMGLLIAAYFLKYSIEYYKLYFGLRKRGDKIQGTVVSKSDPKGGWRLKIPEMRYNYEGVEFVSHVKFPYLVHYFQNVDDECNLLIDRINPQLCIIDSIWYLIIDFVFLSIWLALTVFFGLFY